MTTFDEDLDATVADRWDEYEEHGFVVFPSVLAADDVERYRRALDPHFLHAGRNDFEGLRTNRVYGLLAKDTVFGDMATHPLALAFALRELGPSFLLSAMLAIKLHPGETEQPWHTDDGSIWVDTPRQAFGVSAFWTLDDTTAVNGATEVIPGSHRWQQFQGPGALSPESFVDRRGEEADDGSGAHPQGVAVEMPAGSLMLAKGTLWHRGGANRSDGPRLIVTPQYCPGWARQLENQMAVVPQPLAARYPRRVRELIGYSIHPPFMGYVDGVHPDRLLEAHRAETSEADA